MNTLPGDASAPTVSLAGWLFRLVALSVLPLIALVAWLAADFVSGVAMRREQEARNLGANFATSIDHHLDLHLSALKVLAESPTAADPALLVLLQREANAYKREFDSDVILATAEREVLFNTGNVPDGSMNLVRLPVPQGRSAVSLALESGRGAVGDVFVSPRTQQPAIAIAVPVRRTGQMPHVVLAVLPVSHFQQRIDEVALRADWVIALRDSTGHVIAQKGALPADGSTDNLEFKTQSAASGWTVSVGAPSSAYMASVRRAGIGVALALLAALAIGTLGVTLAGRRLGRALGGLAGGAADTALPSVSELNAVHGRVRAIEGERSTAEDRLRDAEFCAARILDATADGIYGVDREGRISFVNPAACRLLGRGREQLIGQSPHALFHYADEAGAPYAEADCPCRSAAADGSTRRVEDQVFRHADGHAIAVGFASHPVLDEHGAAAGAVVSFVDRTAQRAADDAREHALQAAVTLARTRQEFLANMSHELRTPIHGIVSFATLGARNVGDAEKTKAALARIEQSGRRLQAVVDDVLDLASIEAGKMRIEPKPMSISFVVTQAVESVRELAGGKGLHLVTSFRSGMPDEIDADPERIGQVLRNLLSNAVKFTEKGSIKVVVECGDGTLLLRVIDTGIGMTPADIERAFRPFEQVDGSTTRKFGGAGLGLALTQRIVALMGGAIHVDSRPSEGSSFEVSLPVAGLRIAA